MNTIGLVQYLKDSGISVTFSNGKIIAKPRELLTDEIRKIIINDRKILVLYLQVESACDGLSISPSLVINELLSVENKQDIIKNLITAEALRLHIDLLIASSTSSYSDPNQSKLLTNGMCACGRYRLPFCACDGV